MSQYYPPSGGGGSAGSLGWTGQDALPLDPPLFITPGSNLIGSEPGDGTLRLDAIVPGPPVTPGTNAASEVFSLYYDPTVTDDGTYLGKWGNERSNQTIPIWTLEANLLTALDSGDDTDNHWEVLLTDDLGQTLALPLINGDESGLHFVSSGVNAQSIGGRLEPIYTGAKVGTATSVVFQAGFVAQAFTVTEDILCYGFACPAYWYGLSYDPTPGTPIVPSGHYMAYIIAGDSGGPYTVVGTATVSHGHADNGDDFPPVPQAIFAAPVPLAPDVQYWIAVSGQGQPPPPTDDEGHTASGLFVIACTTYTPYPDTPIDVLDSQNLNNYFQDSGATADPTQYLPGGSQYPPPSFESPGTLLGNQNNNGGAGTQLLGTPGPLTSLFGSLVITVGKVGDPGTGPAAINARVLIGAS